MNNPYQWSSAAKFTNRIATATVAVITGCRNSPVARSYSRRHSSPRIVTAPIVHARPSSTGPSISGSSTAHDPVRNHNSRRNPGDNRPAADRPPMIPAASTTTPIAASTIPRLTGCANAALMPAAAPRSARAAALPSPRRPAR